jgi:hypothetical protein
MDIEAPPPPKTASYNNLFDTNQDVPLGGSAHSLRNHLEGGRLPNGASQPHSPKTRYAYPEHHRTAPMASSEDFSPTNSGPSYKQRPLASDQMYPTTQALITDTVTNPTPVKEPPKSRGPHPPITGTKATHSQGVRTYQVPQTNYYNQTAYNQREALPSVHARIPPPQQQRPQAPSSYVSAAPSRPMYVTESRSPVAKHQQPALPQSSLQSVPGAVRRPMSFVKALEMTDQLAQEEQRRERRRPMATLSAEPVPEEDKRQVYGSSYEISV